MTDPALLAAVIADRDNDLPRLIYADWLDEHGECERAEFIRLQCQVAAWPLHKCDSIYPGCSVSDGRVVSHDHKCEMYPLAQRANELLEMSWADWLPGVQGVYFYRGFAESITCSWSDWLRHADNILKVTPLEKVRLTTMPVGSETQRFGWRSDSPNGITFHSWPGIEFELPQENTYTNISWSPVEPAREYGRRLAQSQMRRAIDRFRDRSE